LKLLKMQKACGAGILPGNWFGMLQRICKWICSPWLVLASFGGGAAESVAMPSASNPAEYKIKHWTTEDGLPQNRIACMQQTRDGYLWIGTWFGLARFDGVHFSVFNKQNTPALAQDAISALAEDSEGNLWLGTRAGLVKYAGGKFSRFTVADGLPEDTIWQLTAARAGGVWLQAGDKIVRGEHDHFRTVWQYPAGDTVHALQEGADGRLNIFLNAQWLRLMPERSVQTNVAEINSRDRIFNAGLAASADTAFVGTSEGLRQLEFGKTNVIMAGGRSGSRADFLLRDGTGNIWSQTGTNGLLRFDGTNWQTINLGEARSGIVCAIQDAQGNFWFGTTDGLMQLELQKIQTFNARDGLPADSVWSVCETADGKIWAGTDRGLAMIQSNQVTAYAVHNGIPFQPFRCVWPAHGGGVWVAGQFNGVFKFLNGKIAEQLNGELAGLPSVLYEDQAGRIWVGTTGGVQCFENGQASGAESLRDVHAILEDHAGDFWFGLKNGELARLHAGQLSFFTDRDGLPGGGVWAIHEAADGALWLGTENGLVRFAGGNFFRFTAPQQMPGDAINCILEDAAGCLWLSTLHGIYRVARTELDAVAAGKAMTVHPFILGTPDGMKTPESNGETQPAGWRTRDGRIWFPTGEGVVVIDPKLFSENESPPHVVLESFRADGQKLLDGNASRISIAAGHGHALEFHFTSCDLAHRRRCGLNRD
jgi:ligand-binding sensor domain-containing protein